MSETTEKKPSTAVKVICYLSTAICVIGAAFLILDYLFLGGAEAIREMVSAYGEEAFGRSPLPGSLWSSLASYPNLSIVGVGLLNASIWLLGGGFSISAFRESRDGKQSPESAILIAIASPVVARVLVGLINNLFSWLLFGTENELIFSSVIDQAFFLLIPLAYVLARGAFYLLLDLPDSYR